MTTKTIFVCDECGASFENKEDAFDHAENPHEWDPVTFTKEEEKDEETE